MALSRNLFVPICTRANGTYGCGDTYLTHLSPFGHDIWVWRHPYDLFVPSHLGVHIAFAGSYMASARDLFAHPKLTYLYLFDLFALLVEACI